MASPADVKETASRPGRSSPPIALFHAIVYVCLALSILICACYKAANASMTHDESSSYLNLVAHRPALNLWNCYYDPACWSNANNHLMNTFLMRWSVKIFGTSEVALRLPNLVLLLIYLWCVVLIVRDSARTLSEGVLGIALMAFNPFLLDFFSLARGYGMGAGWMMLSLLTLWRFFKTGNPLNCLLSFVAATAAVFANLTYIAYVMALTGAVILYIIIPLIRRPRRQLPGVIPMSVAGCLIFLAWYFYRPVLILIGLGEFDYGSATLWEAWKGLARDSLYGVIWFGEKTLDLVAAGSAILCASCILVPWLIRNDENKHVIAFARSLSILSALLVLFFVSSHLLTGAYYPSGRKTIILLPVFGLLIYVAIVSLMRRNQLMAQIGLALIAAILVIHFVRAYNSHTYREWWYDASTKTMTAYVSAQSSGDKPTSLAVEWIFHPSTDYYVRTRHLPVELRPYSKEISPADSVTYYYVHPEHVSRLETHYIVEKNFEGRLLLRIKDR